ncbi:MAG: helix-turn-helix transcriptional regulator, partial [Pseudomonadota bacterium]
NLRTVERYAQSIEARIIVELEAAEGTVDTVPLGEAVERLSGLRREAGVSQTVVAKRMEATQPAVARIERGEPAPNLKTIERYANAIGFGLNLRVDLNK